MPDVGFGVKFRAVASFGGNVANDGDKIKDPFGVSFDLLPYFAISDNVCIFLSFGLNMMMPADNEDLTGVKKGDSVTGFHINPYLQVGPEWGPSFWVGFKLATSGDKVLNSDKDGPGDDNSKIVWSVPIAIQVSF
jgi:hypothetical protein